MNKFEKITSYQNIDFNLPCRKTARAAGYDFEVVEDILIPSYFSLMEKAKSYYLSSQIFTLEEMAGFTKYNSIKPTLVPTGVKCQLEPDCYLELSVRSSTPLKYWLILANSVGIIDADYYNNSDNEGHIYFQIINLSPFDIQLKKGDIIGQGIIHKYETADDDSASGIRNGGFGSTTPAAQAAAALKNTYQDVNIADWDYKMINDCLPTSEELAKTINDFAKYVANSYSYTGV